jgi:hemolysin activation/secretion protein
MKLETSAIRGLNFAARLLTFAPITLALPALAESFALPSCPFPEVLQSKEILLIECDKPEPPPPTEKGGTKPQNPSTASAPPPTIGDAPVVNNTVLSPTEITELLLAGKDKPANRDELCKISNQMTKVYRDRGYLLANVLPMIDRKTRLPYKDNRTLGFLAIEGCVESIDIKGTQRLKPSYVKDRISAGLQSPFNTKKINDLLALIQTDPHVGKLEILGLLPGKSFGSSALSLKVTDANSLAGFVGVDTQIAPIFGGVRAIGGGTYRNVTGNADDFNAAYFRSVSGEVQGADFSYQIPVNAMDGKVSIRYAPVSARLVLQPNSQPFTLDGSTAEVNFRQPLVRNSRSEFAVSLGMVVQNEQTTLNGVGTNTNGVADSSGKTRTTVIQLAQDYTSLDDLGNWTLRSQFNLGIGAFDATTNDRPIADGRFFSWQANAQRVQRFTPSNYAVAQLGFQLTPDRLVPNQQFTLGGDRAILGYRQNLRSSDNGIRLSVEDRAIIGRNSTGGATLQLVGNASVAQVWNNGGDNLLTGASSVSNGRFLASVGVGAIWEPVPRLVTRFDYAIPLASITDRGNSFQDSGFSFSVGYGF